MKTKVQQYAFGSKVLHWIIALIVVAMLFGSFFLGSVPETYQANAYMLHKSFGLTVLALMVCRLIWIIYRGKPTIPASVPTWERRLSHVIQWLMYVFLFAMPLVGWTMSVAADHPPTFFGLFTLSLPITPNKVLAELLANLHATIAWILIGLISLHILGALKHYFLDRDKMLQRMLF